MCDSGELCVQQWGIVYATVRNCACGSGELCAAVRNCGCNSGEREQMDRIHTWVHIVYTITNWYIV